MAKYDGNPQDYTPLIESGYEFNLEAYLKRGWDLFTQNVSGFIAYVFIFSIISAIISQIGGMLGMGNLILTFVMTQVANIPVIGLAAGFLIMAHKIAQNQDFEFGSFFEGLKDMIQLWVASFISGILALIPLAIGFYLAMGDEMLVLYQNLQDATYVFNNSEEILANLVPYGAKFAMYGGAAVVLSILISTLYIFTQAFILFQRLSFWDAMESSRKIIRQKLGSFFLLWLVLIVGFVALIVVPMGISFYLSSGFLMFFAGLFVLAVSLVSIPYFYCVIYAAFEHIVLNNVKGSSMDTMIDEIGND